MLSRINDAIHYNTLRLVTRFNELPPTVQAVIFTVSVVVVVILGVHFGVLSKGNPGGHIPMSWRHSF
jgi:hypothetical protein